MKHELRTKSVGTKVPEAELRVLESRAERAGVTLPEWVRDVLPFTIIASAIVPIALDLLQQTMLEKALEPESQMQACYTATARKLGTLLEFSA